ncbi:MAG: RnfABCDGE type electron transport complex subunit G [Bacteroidales bacterium]|nr:RnfABCDGE type electron transport complex subunit G [Bacteroidales bacterium]
MVLVLMLVCLGASAAVAVVYAVTKDPIDAAEVAKKNSAIKEVVPEFDNNPYEEALDVMADQAAPDKTNKVYPAKKGGEIVGYAVESTTTKGFGGPFTIMVGFTPDGKVYNTSVISHSETPGLGAKITDSKSGFITQWNGKNLLDGSVNISVKKDGGDIDAITASTISSRAFCDAMQIAANVFNNISTEK